MRIPARTLAALALLASAALAGGTTTVATFDGGVNLGGWTYGTPPALLPTGGNPGAFLAGAVDTFAPQLRTTGDSVFTGDWRARGVTSFGVDLKTFSTQFPALRECTLMLTSGGCSVFYLGTEFVPQPGAGWESFDFTVDSASTTLPEGWATFGTCPDPDVAWNNVITDVTQVTIFYGNPTFFYIFDIWEMGADNLRITEADDPWTDLGGGSVGQNGVPALVGTGPLTAGSQLGVQLTSSPSSEFVLLWIALAPTPFAAIGGTVQAFPFNAQFLGATDAAGALSGSATVPALPPGTELTLQFVCQDPTSIHGLTLSNGVRGTVP